MYILLLFLVVRAITSFLVLDTPSLMSSKGKMCHPPIFVRNINFRMHIVAKSITVVKLAPNIPTDILLIFLLIQFSFILVKTSTTVQQQTVTPWPDSRPFGNLFALSSTLNFVKSFSFLRLFFLRLSFLRLSYILPCKIVKIISFVLDSSPNNVSLFWPPLLYT